jgi:Uma2 family endonuclease
MPTTRPMTEAELMSLPRDGMKREYVGGEIRVSPAGWRHGLVSTALAAELHAHARAGDLGRVADSSTGFWMPSGNLRVPDAAFVSKARSPGEAHLGFSNVVPDIAAEVLSPGDSAGEILEKVAEYLESGVRLVWVIDPERLRATVHRADGMPAVLEGDDALDGEDVLPGFRCPLTKLWP